MKKINILTKNIYNRIAAGEVIDRPYSAVKELIENSIDAGATQIDVYIERGGKQLIKIVDNGCGVERDDMRAAFLPHATSKISSVDDLENIATLGFRGEALASISVISKVTITSVTEGNSAYCVKCEDGLIGQVEEAALDKGTEICVRDLFYNTPVRAKFLKADKKEEADITSFVTRYILCKPEISFRYFVDGKLVLQSHGGGLDEAVAQVYGAKVITQCFKIDAEKEGIKIHGYIGNQNFFKPNKTYQSLFLNGRYIVNNTIATAISNAYASYAMKRQYPFYVLNVDVPSEMVDVNVHPNKADVRFVDNRLIFGAIYSVVSSILDGTAKAAQFVVDSVRIPEIKSTHGSEPNKVYSAPVSTTESKEPLNFLDDSAFEHTENKKVENLNFFDTVVTNPIISVQKPAVMIVSNSTMPRGYGDARIENAINHRQFEQQMIEFESCKFKGNLFNTYLIYELGDTVYLIDQHAAHERLIYDRLREKMSNRKIEGQGLIIPYLFDTNAQETEFIENNIELIRKMGFDLKPFGIGSFRVDEVPTDLQDIDLSEFFKDLLSDLKELKDIKLEEMLKDKIAMTACKHAVRGGKQLTDDEVEALFKMMKGNMGLKCPHGRPVCVTLDKKDIEKMFKRIV
ncbi:MAG: DNA mismatch repair endonuclease MutL [Clostridia bacterium]|nr:DNA mismatch repair endonuclease MutL [Clostridia bacterium]